MTKYVSISGPVAAGKTTLLNGLLLRLGERAQAREERPQDNPFLRAYYTDPMRWSFHSQIAFLSLYFDSDTWREPKCDFYFFDRCLTENLVLARYRLEVGDLTEAEYSVIEKTARGIGSLMPEIDRYLYLNCSVDLLTQRLRQRGRDYESGLDREYARKLKTLYDEWAEQLPRNRVLVVDEDKGVDWEVILRFLEEK